MSQTEATASTVVAVHPQPHTVLSADQFEQLLARAGGKSLKTKVSEAASGANKGGWMRMVLPIIISSLLSAAMTGVGTVSSISREIAVEHASVSILLADHDRRIGQLEKDIVPRVELDNRRQNLNSTLDNLRDQMKQTSASVDDIRKMLYEQHYVRK